MWDRDNRSCSNVFHPGHICLRGVFLEHCSWLYLTTYCLQWMFNDQGFSKIVLVGKIVQLSVSSSAERFSILLVWICGSDLSLTASPFELIIFISFLQVWVVQINIWNSLKWSFLRNTWQTNIKKVNGRRQDYYGNLSVAVSDWTTLSESQ